jgi:hypothetical protein
MPRILTDHETILRWAHACGVEPMCAESRPDAQGVMLHLVSAGDRVERPGRRISWPAWFHLFDAQNLALVIEDAIRQPSPVHRVIKRPPTEMLAPAGA